MDQGLISNPADLFSLTQGDLIPLERFEEKSADNLIKAIEESKKISLAKFIHGLGIRHVGEETAINLAHYFGSLKKLEKANLEELSKVKDIGRVVAQSVFRWFNNRANKELIDQLIARGVEISKLKTVKRKLTGQTFVLTGELNKFTREQTKERIRELGGDISGSVSSQTDFVVVGENPGSKYQKAKKLGVKILEEKEFLKYVG